MQHNSHQQDPSRRQDPDHSADLSHLQQGELRLGGAEHTFPMRSQETLRRTAPLEQGIQQRMKGELLGQFAEHLPQMLEIATDYFSTLMPNSENFYGDSDGAALQERHGSVKRMLVDLIESGDGLRLRVEELLDEAESEVSGARLYDQEIVPWLHELNGFVEAIAKLDGDISEFVEDYEDDDYDDDEDDDSFDDLDEEDDEFAYDPSEEFALEEGITFDNGLGDKRAEILDLVDIILPCRYLLSRSESLLLPEQLELASSEINTSLLELARSRGIPCQYSSENPVAGIHPSELQFCLNFVTDTVQSHFESVFADELAAKLGNGELYKGESSAGLRESASEHYLTQFPMLAGTSGQGVIVFTHAIPGLLAKRWEEELEPLREKLELATQVLEARGHGLAVVYDPELRAFSVKVQLRNAIEQEDNGEAAYCDAQQKFILGDRNFMASLDKTTLVRLPRQKAGESDNGSYSLHIEAAVMPFLGNSRTTDSFIRQADKLAGEIPGIDRIAVNAQTEEGEVQEIVEAYENGGEFTFRLASSDFQEPGAFSQGGRYEKEKLIETVRNVSSDPYADSYIRAQPFVVSTPSYGEPPRGKLILLDEALAASGDIRRSLKELGEAGDLRVKVSRDFTGDYSGSRSRVEFIEDVLEQSASAARNLGDRFGGLSLEWFAGVEVNGQSSFDSGLLVRLYDREGHVVVQGLATGSERQPKFLKSVDQELLQRADTALSNFASREANSSTKLSEFQQELSRCGLELDEFFLHSTVWHMQRGSLQPTGFAPSPKQLVSELFRHPQITAEDREGMVVLRRTEPGDFLDV